MKKDVINSFYAKLRDANPEPKGELNYVNAYTLLVAVVLSAQATDVGVNRATRALFKVADTPKKMIELGEAKVKDHIKTLHYRLDSSISALGPITKGKHFLPSARGQSKHHPSVSQHIAPAADKLPRHILSRSFLCQGSEQNTH